MHTNVMARDFEFYTQRMSASAAQQRPAHVKVRSRRRSGVRRGNDTVADISNVGCIEREREGHVAVGQALSISCRTEQACLRTHLTAP